MKVYNTQQLVINYWTRIPLAFTVKIKYTNSSSNNEDNFIIPIAKANITKQTEKIQLIEGTIQSVSILTPSDMILRGHIFFQCWVCDMNSQIPIHILFSDYLTAAKPIGFPYTGIQDNGYDIENGLLISDFIDLSTLGLGVVNFDKNTLVKIEEILYSGKLLGGGGNGDLYDQFVYNDLTNFPVIGQPEISLFPTQTIAANTLTQIFIQRNADKQVLTNAYSTINSFRLYDIPIIPNTTIQYASYSWFLTHNVWAAKSYLQVTRKELINII